MRQFYLLRMGNADQRPSFSKVRHLIKKLDKIRSSFVIYKGIGNETNMEPRLFHTDTEFDVFSKAIEGKAFCCVIHLSRNPHIETSRLKPSHAFFSAAD